LADSGFTGVSTGSPITGLGASGTYRAMSRSGGGTGGCPPLNFRGSNLWVRIS
jgi:hypothetical protein